MKHNLFCIPRWWLYLFSIMLSTVSVNEANYNFTIHFYEFYTPTIQCQSRECRVHRNCTTQQSVNCSISFRFLLRPFGVESAPQSHSDYPYFTPESGDNNETFDEGPDGFLGLPNPYTITNHTGKWTGMIQLFIVALNKLSTTQTGINHFHIDLELNPGPNFTERTTYIGRSIFNVPDVRFDMSFRVQCLENYFGPNCTTFCEPLEGVYTCDIEACNTYDPNQNMSSACIQCLNSEYNPKTNCTTCLPALDMDSNCTRCLIPEYDIETRCTKCTLFGYDPMKNCSTCLPGRDSSSNCTHCSLGYDPSKDCSICLPGRNIKSSCTECLAGLDLSTNCSECVNRKLNPYTNCSECVNRKLNPYTNCSECVDRKLDPSTNCSKCVNRKLDPSTGCTLCLQRGQDHTSNCTECLQNYDKITSCSTCLFGWDISTNCTGCQPNRNISNSCRICNNRSVLIGSDCISVDPCASKPCQNGGTCVALYAPTAAGYYCLCKSGYVGLHCEDQNMTQTESGTGRSDAQSSSVVVVGGALGGFVVLLIIVCIVMVMVIIYLGYELWRGHNRIKESRKQTKHGEQAEQTFLQEPVGTLDSNNSEVAHNLHNPLYDCAEEVPSTMAQERRMASDAIVIAEGNPKQEADYDVAYPKASSEVVEGAVYDVAQQQHDSEQGAYNVTVHPVSHKRAQQHQTSEIAEYAYAGIDIVQKDPRKAIGTDPGPPKYDYADATVLTKYAKKT